MPSEVMRDVTPNSFRIGDVKFRVHRPGDQRLTTTEDEIVVLKGPDFLAQYDRIFSDLPSKNVMEVGIFEGGSAIYFGLAFPHLKFVGVDLKSPSDIVLGHIKRLGLSDQVSLHYEVDQADRNRLLQILSEEFGQQSLGVVIDDASHFYAQSKATFETLFPRLAVGGTYCLEDWAWAHEPGQCQTDVWIDRPALSNLLFEIIIAQASHGGSIGEISVERTVATIKRGSRPLGRTLSDMMLTRGKKLELI